ncbi:MAG: isochorismatase family protein [candidate division NC10 bacterium]|nr:isochorismatase family protein [candidate division NC10 bacterium]MDE2321479.1 isochorismatase family protein [candidate division NC10 bacterium]
MCPVETQKVTLSVGDALIVVDVQNDFLPGGGLAVVRGDEVIPVLNRYLAAFVSRGLPIFATRDWHPPNHCSFQPYGGPWPPHCVAGSEGAAFATALELPASSTLITLKGTQAEKDAYSAFDGTDLDARLRAQGIGRVFVGGLATDYCILCTVEDGLKAGYAVVLLQDAIRAVNVRHGDGERAEAEMIRRGAIPIRLEMLAA